MYFYAACNPTLKGYINYLCSIVECIVVLYTLYMSYISPIINLYINYTYINIG